MYPRLRHCTMLDAGAGAPLRLIVGDKHFELSETAGSRERFLRFKSLLDGRRDVAGISALSGLSESDVAGLLDVLSKAGLMRREEPVDIIPADLFRTRIAATLSMWRRQIGFHRLFDLLMQAEARKEMLQGLFIESYHAVRLAPKHIAVAAACADDEAHRALLARYMGEEADHAHFLLDTCVNLGCDRDAVASSHPTVGTLSLINMLCEIGRQDSLAYIAGTLLFEAVPDDVREGENGVEVLARSYGLSPSAFEPALRHLRLDAQMEHVSLLDRALAGYGSISAERAHGIVNMLHDLKHAYDQHHDQIIQYYGDISNYIPRPKVDWFSL